VRAPSRSKTPFGTTMPRIQYLRLCWPALVCCASGSHLSGEAAPAPPVSAAFDVRDYGAVGDGKTLDTKAIQVAVDACADAGGGAVLIAGGTFLSGTIDLRDNVTLHLQAGAVLLASTRQEDFTARSMIHAEKVRNIAVTGRGIIDGHGDISTEFPKVRAHPIHFIECRNVRVRDVTFRNSTTWIQHYFKCDDLVIDGIVQVASRSAPLGCRPGGVQVSRSSPSVDRELSKCGYCSRTIRIAWPPLEAASAGMTAVESTGVSRIVTAVGLSPDGEASE
jgi:Pectate lyase superfamily protein